MPPQLQYRDIIEPAIQHDEQSSYYYGMMRCEPRLAGDPFFLLQLDIRIDRHYSHQSYALAKVWSVPLMQFVELTKLLPDQIGGYGKDKGETARTPRQEWLASVAHKLIQDSARIIGTIRGEKIYA